MTFYQHGDRSGDRPGQVPKVDGDSCPCVVTRTGPHLTRVDAILAAIDTGLQTAGDTAYGDDWPGTCWRCQYFLDDADDGDDLCAKCRMHLLAERVTTDAYLTVLLSLDIGPFVTALEGLMVAFDHLSPDLRRRIVEIINEEQPNYARSITQ